ncbi:MAG: ribonuclease H-like domain-containing protein [Firmicutes bacterium]|nr:ribonuclease H-like domain-containing protein [Bacillota bacterium]
MEHIRAQKQTVQYHSAIWNQYFHGRSICVLDIETTGLDRSRCRFVLGGLMDMKTGTLHQVFADHTEEEAQALAEFMALADRFDVVVTYNGRHFDMPFLAERIDRVRWTKEAIGRAGRPAPHNGYDLDLYQVVNGHSPIRRLLPNLKQKTVESYMGLWQDRSDEISGAESVELYMDYMRTKDPEARRQILLHNSDDVLQLQRLLPVIEKSDFHKAMYHMGFPVGSPMRRWQVRKIGFHRDRMLVEGIQGAGRVDYRGYEMGHYPMHSFFDAKAGTFRLEVPVVRQAGICAADLRAWGADEREFQKYPGFGSGFLVVEDPDGVKYREVNHFVQALIGRFEKTI